MRLDTNMKAGSGRAPSMPASPFFRPSNPRLSKIKSPNGTQYSSAVVKKRVGGETKDVPLEDLEKKSSVLGAYANLCNVTIGAGIVGLVRRYIILIINRLYLY